MLAIAIGGVVALIALAIVIGGASDRDARNSAWRRIADGRRINGEIARSNQDRQSDLADWADELILRERLLVRCENCPRRFPPPDQRA